MRNRFVYLLMLSLFLPGNARTQAKSVASTATAQKTPARKTVAAAKEPFKPALLKPASLTAKAPAIYEAKFVTTKGGFVIQVTREWSPLGADRFYNLVKNGYYDGASFFRVAPGFVVQFGINPFPQVSAAWKNASIKDDPVKASNKKGFVAFATGGPNTRTTQVFISLKDNSRLDGMGFSAFGEVTEGMAVVEQLYSGYGDGPPFGKGPDQSRIEAEGKKYLDATYPNLDSIKSATVRSLAPAPGAAVASKKAPVKKAKS